MNYAPPPANAGPEIRINLYSDTQTKPTHAMREAMMSAEVGDEQHGNDPTVTLLCGRVADLLGKEAAMFLPSGTMCNEIAILTHCRPGDEILAHETAHILASEGGAPAALAGALVKGLRGERGMFDGAVVEQALRRKTRYTPAQTMLSVEQTSNLGGGAVWPLHKLRTVAELAHEHDMVTHMDGARLMNAVVVSGISACEMAVGYDSVWLDFTKGLGAPLGAVLAGTHEFIGAAWRWKQRMGGAMRQAGICAAACLYALDHHVARLAEDHDNAKFLARGLAECPQLIVEPPETNLVYFDISGTGQSAEHLEQRLRRRGIALSIMGPHRMRACLHLDITRAHMEEALDEIRQALVIA